MDPGPWEIWTSKGYFEVKISNSSGTWDPQFEILRTGLWTNPVNVVSGRGPQVVVRKTTMNLSKSLLIKSEEVWVKALLPPLAVARGPQIVYSLFSYECVSHVLTHNS